MFFSGMFFVVLVYLLELELCALVENASKSCLRLKFHPLTIFSYWLNVFLFICLCDFR